LINLKTLTGKFIVYICYRSIEPRELEISKLTVSNEKAVYEEEMIKCMKMAKHKVQSLADKLKLAKQQIVKLSM
jgi:dsDNA-specific endonuclease/ATPase MutS2